MNVPCSSLGCGNTLSQIVNMLAYKSISLQEDMPLHPDTCYDSGMPSLAYTAACLKEKQQIKNFVFGLTGPEIEAMILF